MKIKSLIAVSIIAPLLALSLAAKADTCPTPEEFSGSKNTFYISPNGDFALGEGQKPTTFAGAVFMSTDKPVNELRPGKIYACLYLIKENGKEIKKYALLQGVKTKAAAIAADSEDWKVTRKNRYDCESSYVETCQFNLYHIQQ